MPIRVLNDSDFDFEERPLVIQKIQALDSVSSYFSPMLMLFDRNLAPRFVTNFTNYNEYDWERYCVWLNRTNLLDASKKAKDAAQDAETTLEYLQQYPLPDLTKLKPVKKSGLVSSLVGKVTSIFGSSKPAAPTPEELEIREEIKKQKEFAAEVKEKAKTKREESNNIEARKNFFVEEGKTLALPKLSTDPSSSFFDTIGNEMLAATRMRLITRPENYWRAITSFFATGNFQNLPICQLLSHFLTTDKGRTVKQYNRMVRFFTSDVMTDTSRRMLAVMDKDYIHVLVPDSHMVKPVPQTHFRCSYFKIPVINNPKEMDEVQKRMERRIFIDTTIVRGQFSEVVRYEVFDYEIYKIFKQHINIAKGAGVKFLKEFSRDKLCPLPIVIMKIIFEYAATGMESNIFALQRPRPVGSLYQIRLQKEREQQERSSAVALALKNTIVASNS